MNILLLRAWKMMFTKQKSKQQTRIFYFQILHSYGLSLNIRSYFVRKCCCVRECQWCYTAFLQLYLSNNSAVKFILGTQMCNLNLLAYRKFRGLGSFPFRSGWLSRCWQLSYFLFYMVGRIEVLSIKYTWAMDGEQYIRRSCKSTRIPRIVTLQ